MLNGRDASLTGYVAISLFITGNFASAAAACPAPYPLLVQQCSKTGSSSRALQERGVGCYGARDYERAISAFTQALSKGCAQEICLGNRARARIAAGDLDEAIADLDTLGSSYKRGHSYRAIAYFKKQDFERAVIEADAALTRDGSDVEAMYVRGLAKAAAGDAAGGSSDQRMAQEMDNNASFSLGDLQQYFECTHGV